MKQTDEMKPYPNKTRFHLLSCGYLRKYFTTKNTNPKDIAQIIVKFLVVNWNFDYTYLPKDSQSSHGIFDNGKTITCDNKNRGYCCYCFYRISFGMVPNSGIYSIKIKVDNFLSNNVYLCNAIGITCNTHPTNNSKVSSGDYWYCSHDYIAWSTYNKVDPYPTLPNGLLCGYLRRFQNKNIFNQTKFVYKSKNQHYKERLPCIKPGDTIIMQYDSNKNILSFFKTNDNKLDASISNLPKDKTFHWIVGHCEGKMSITIAE